MRKREFYENNNNSLISLLNSSKISIILLIFAIMLFTYFSIIFLQFNNNSNFNSNNNEKLYNAHIGSVYGLENKNETQNKISTYATTNNEINVTIPSEIDINFDAKGVATVTGASVSNNNLVPLNLNDLTITRSPTSKTSWNLVDWNKSLAKTSNDLAMRINGNNLVLASKNDFTTNTANKISIPKKSTNQSLNLEVKNRVFTANKVKSNDLIFNFNFTLGENEFNATFDTGNGNKVIPPITAKNGKSITLPTTIYGIKSGYHIISYESDQTDSSGNKISYKPGATVTMPIGGIKFKAVYSANTITVKYHAGGAKDYNRNNPNTTDVEDWTDVSNVDVIRTDSKKYDEVFEATNGLVDSEKRLKKPGITSSKYWKVGSLTSTTKINSYDGLPTSQVLAEKVGKLEDFKNGNVTLDLYPDFIEASKITKPGESVNKLIDGTVTSVIFTDTVAPNSLKTIDMSNAKDYGVVSWIDTSTKTQYISTQRTGEKVELNQDSYRFFYNKAKLEKVDFNNLVDSSNTETLDGFFRDCSNLTEIKSLNTLDTSSCKYFGGMFWNTGLKSLDLSTFNTSNALSMHLMFADNVYLETLNLSSFDTSKISSSQFYGLFRNDNKLSKITLSSKFEFIKNTSTTQDQTVLPTPSKNYIPNSDGYWYNVNTNARYSPENVPSKTAATYVAQRYTITYANCSGATIPTSNPSYVAKGLTKDLTVNPVTKPGYDFTGWTNTGVTTPTTTLILKAGSITNDITLKANWKARTDTKYVVNHYKQNLDGKTYTLDSSENKTGTSDSSITTSTLSKTYTGFSYSNSKVDNGTTAVTTTTIDPRGTRVINLYYDRNKLSYDLNGYLDGVVYPQLYTTDSSGNQNRIFGKVDIYINGIKVGNQLADRANGYNSVLYGSTIEVKNINAMPGVHYNGIYKQNDNGAASLKFTLLNDTKICLKFDTIQSNIAYDVNGGNALSSPKTSYNVVTNTFSIANPTRTGHTFTGWTEQLLANDWHDGFVSLEDGSLSLGTTGAAYPNAQYSDFIRVKKGITYTTSLAENDACNLYRIRLYDDNLNLIKAAIGGEDSDVGKKSTFTPSSDGYIRYLVLDKTITTPNTLYVTSNAGKGVSVIKGSTGNRKYIANWSKNNYTLTYNVNGGNALTTTSKSITYGSVYGTLPTPTRTGYRFTGWYTSTDSNATKVSNTTTMGASNTTIYAHWTANVLTVNYHANGAEKWDTHGDGNFSDLNSKDIVRTDKFNYDTELNAQYGLADTTRLTKTGYNTDNYWYVGSATSSTKISDSLSLPTSQTLAKAAGKLTDFNKGNVTIDLYPKWTVKTVEVTFHRNTSTSDTTTATQTFTYGVSGQTISSKGWSRTGYTLDGWCLSPNGTTRDYTVNSSVANSWIDQRSPSVDLYALWKVNTYTINYNLDGGTVSKENPTSYNVNTASFTLNNPTKNGYTFVGWTGSNGTTASKTVTIAKGSTGNKTYTANWERNKTYILNTGREFKNAIPSTTTIITFTDIKAPNWANTTDLTAAGDGSVVGWLDGTTWYVSTQNNKKIIFNKDCAFMFSKINIETINFDNIDTSNVTNMEYMFSSWTPVGNPKPMNLKQLDLSSFNTSNVTDMNCMFSYCNKLEILNISNFNTSKVTNMSSMFATCSSLNSLDLFNFNTSNVTDMMNIFYDCSNLKTIYVSNLWNISNLNCDDRWMFTGCTNLIGESGTTYDGSKTDKSMANYQTGYLTYKKAN